MVAAINVAGEVVAVHMADGSIDRVEFKKFLGKIFRKYGGERVNIYLDNLNVHKGDEIKSYCEDNNAELLFGPTYSSHLNPIERLWAFAKGPWRKRCVMECDFANRSQVKSMILQCIDEAPTSGIEKKV